MPAMTKSRLRNRVDNLIKDGYKLAMNVNAGGCRITTANEQTDLSPRGTPREIDLWLDGFVSGVVYKNDVFTRV